MILIVGAVFWGWHSLYHPYALYRSAQAQFEKNPRKAAQFLEEAVAASDGTYPKAQLLWCRSLLRMNRWQEAIGCFTLIQEPSTLPGEQLLELAHEASAAGVPLLAAFSFEAVPQGSSVFQQANMGLLEVRYHQGHWMAVIELSNQLAAPLNAGVLFKIARSYEQLGNFPRSDATFRRFLETPEQTEQDRIAALRSLLRMSIASGDGTTARDWLTRLQETVLPEPMDEVLEARLLRMEGKTVAAAKKVDDILAVYAGFPLAIELRGTLAVDRGDWQGAEKDLQTTIRINPWNKSAHYKLGVVLRQQGRTKEAGKHFDRNRKLTEAASRILELQKQKASGSAETERLRNLAEAYEVIGQRDKADKIRRGLEMMKPSA